MTTSDSYKRPRAYVEIYQWHIGMVPEKIELHGESVDNPARKNAIFVVHGMGEQTWSETAAVLRSGFEDVLETIDAENPDAPLRPSSMPSPFISEGFWADYGDLAETFPEEVKRLEPTKQNFFSLLWKKRTVSVGRTLAWFLGQQIKLINPSVIWRIHFVAWLLYIPLQLVSFSSLMALWLFKRRILSDVLGDVRLYAAPKGVIERAIVQRIDYRVGSAFLRMLGLNWDFMPLKPSQMLESDGKPIVFGRIIWVAHSLGSVISYNALSDLFQRANILEKSGKPQQQQGVRKFRDALARFITIGSPLDKIAFLLGEDALRPWPSVKKSDAEGVSPASQSSKPKVSDFWVNFYHVFDPVSGALQNPLICGDDPPRNFHVGFWKIPGVAHVGYWKDRSTLKYILSRLYGKAFLPVTPERHLSPVTLTLLALVGYALWGGIIAGIVWVILCALWPLVIFVFGWVAEVFTTFFPCIYER